MVPIAKRYRTHPVRRECLVLQGDRNYRIGAGEHHHRRSVYGRNLEGKYRLPLHARAGKMVDLRSAAVYPGISESAVPGRHGAAIGYFAHKRNGLSHCIVRDVKRDTCSPRAGMAYWAVDYE